ncbi:MAG TPA: hypothetical protein P5079_04060 [Elusimicrobiota bacterium]|nr:hypothetical protein [Elusimicrobiota bacterium]
MENSKTFIIPVPGDSLTGGPEALHQLAREINDLPDCQAFIHYTGRKDPRVAE